MSDETEWEIPATAQPRPGEWSFDLERALAAVVAVRTEIPADAFTASILGTERAGSGVVIDQNGLILTIGYLITEADDGVGDGRGRRGGARARGRLRPGDRLRPDPGARPPRRAAAWSSAARMPATSAIR